MSGEIDGHCPTLHHPFIVSLNVFTTLFLPHLHFASLDMAISETARDIHFLELMHFIWSAKPPQLTSCHSGLPYDITPLAPAVPPRPPPRPHPLPPPSLRCLKQLQCPTVTGCSVIVFCRVLSAPVVLSFTFQYFSSKMALFGVYFSQRLELRPSGEQYLALGGLRVHNHGARPPPTKGLEVFWRA